MWIFWNIWQLWRPSVAFDTFDHFDCNAFDACIVFSDHYMTVLIMIDFVHIVHVQQTTNWFSFCISAFLCRNPQGDGAFAEWQWNLEELSPHPPEGQAAQGTQWSGARLEVIDVVGPGADRGHHVWALWTDCGPICM